MAEFKVKLKDEEIISIIRADIENAENYFTEEILPKLQEYQDIYFANNEYYSKLMPVLHRQSKFISKDVASGIEWLMPSLMRVFLGSDDVIVIHGRTEDDVNKAKIMQKLINFQLTCLNNGFMKFYRWFKDALVNGCGILKGYWQREYEEKIEEDFMGEEQFRDLQQDENIEVLDYEVHQQPIYNIEDVTAEPSIMYKVKYKIKNLKKNEPVLANIRPEHFGFDPLANDIDGANFCYHKKWVTADYLLRKEKSGFFRNVKKAIEKGEDYEMQNDYATYSQNLEYQQRTQTDEARKKYKLYEYYGKIDINKDGLLENVIVHVCNDVILSIQENTYGMFPFFILSPVIEPYKFWGRGFSDIIGQLQNLKTLLIKEIIINIAQSNNGRLIINQDFVNMDDVLSNKKIIRTRGQMPIQNIATPFPFEPIHQATFPLLEYIEVTKENELGITRYSQGLDARSLNKTASGISMIMNASQQRMELIARIFAETGIKRLFQFLVESNLKFIDQNQVVRLTNEQLDISPDDFSGQFDLQVNAGIGMSNKQEQVQQLQMILDIAVRVLLPLQLVTPQNIRNIVKRLLEEMGYKNVSAFLSSEEQIQQQQAMQQMMPQQGQSQPEQQGNVQNIMQLLAQGGK